jgi:hypothetical protein
MTADGWRPRIGDDPCFSRADFPTPAACAVIASESLTRHCERSEAIQPRTAGAQAKMRHMARTHTGLLRRGACHRAALRADPVAPRNGGESFAHVSHSFQIIFDPI